MRYTTKTKLHATPYFQLFGRGCERVPRTQQVHTFETRSSSFRRDGPQIWQRFLAVRRSWTCAGVADVKSGNVL